MLDKKAEEEKCQKDIDKIGRSSKMRLIHTKDSIKGKIAEIRQAHKDNLITKIDPEQVKKILLENYSEKIQLMDSFTYATGTHVVDEGI